MIKKRRRVALFFLILLITIICVSVTFLKENNKPKVVVVLKSLDIEYWRIFEAGAQKAFNDFNIDGSVLAPASEKLVSEQVNILKNVLNQNPDALILTPSQPSAVIPLLTEYDEKNIPVLFADTDFNWEGKTAFIGTNNSHLGKMAGQLIGSMLYPGNQVAFITSNSVVANERITSAKEALESVGIEIVIHYQGDDKYGNVKSVMGTILKEYPNIKGIFAVDDNIALEALEEIKENELMIPVVGVDGTSKMLESVIDGTLNATVSQNPYDMGYVSVAQSLKVIKGQQVEKSFDSGVDIITQENAKDRLKFLERILK